MTTDASALARVVDYAVAKFTREPGALLEILHAVQNDLGCVPPDAMPLIADALNISRAEVHGVVSFYHHFREQPPGRCVVQICRAEACKAMQGDELAKFAVAHLGLGFGETRADGAVSLQSVYCLGNCACAPSMRVNGRLHGRANARVLERLVKESA